MDQISSIDNMLFKGQMSIDKDPILILKQCIDSTYLLNAKPEGKIQYIPFSLHNFDPGRIYRFCIFSGISGQ